MFRIPAMLALLPAALASAALLAAPSEITVDIKLDSVDYVSGERVRAVVDVVNLSPATLRVGYPDSTDRLFVEVYRSGDMSQLDAVSDRRFVSEFILKSNEGQKLETFLGAHYGLREPRRYLCKPVLVHAGKRYEGQLRAFDIVPGMRITGALQMFANADGLQREFDLLYWRREGRDHLFLAAHDEGGGDRKWETWDLGQIFRITKPTVSVMPGGEVVVFHRVDADWFVRTEFWSVPAKLRFHNRELVQDPETAGQNRVRELYRESGGVEAKPHPWWKFW